MTSVVDIDRQIQQFGPMIPPLGYAQFLIERLKPGHALPPHSPLPCIVWVKTTPDQAERYWLPTVCRSHPSYEILPESVLAMRLKAGIIGLGGWRFVVCECHGRFIE